MVVLRVALEMLGQIVDALRQDRDLDFGRTGVALVAGMFLDQRSLRSAVIDIVLLLYLDVEAPDDLQAVGQSFDQCDRASASVAS